MWNPNDKKKERKKNIGDDSKVNCKKRISWKKIEKNSYNFFLFLFLSNESCLKCYLSLALAISWILMLNDSFFS